MAKALAKGRAVHRRPRWLLWLAQIAKGRFLVHYSRAYQLLLQSDFDLGLNAAEAGPADVVIRAQADPLPNAELVPWRVSAQGVVIFHVDNIASSAGRCLRPPFSV